AAAHTVPPVPKGAVVYAPALDHLFDWVGELSAEDCSAVDPEQLAGDEPGVSRGEESNRRSDLFRGTRPPYQRAIDPYLVELGIESVPEELRVWDVARQDKVGGNSVPAKPFGKPEDPRMQGGLGCAVRSAVPAAQLGADRPQSDHATTWPNDVWLQSLHEQDGGHQVLIDV